ncbi:MAG: GNAT family N-acetyltransferase [Planctomycetota bacterium]
MNGHDHADSTWNRAVRADEHGDPFCCRTEWQLSFQEAIAPDRALELRVEGDSAVLFARRARRGVPMLEPIDNSWMFGSTLLGPQAVPMLAELIARRPGCVVVLSGLLTGGGRVRELLRAFGAGHELLLVKSETACIASLDGGLDGYLSRRSAKLRRGLRSASRRAADRGVSFERHAPTTEAACDAVYARVLAVERRSWKGIGRCGMAESPSREFYHVMLRRLCAARGGRVMFATHDGEDIGFILGCVGSGVYRGQQFSFVDTWRPDSIGNLLQLEQLRWLCDEGVARYDMGPLMDYKRSWTETHQRFDAVAMRPR